MRVTVPDQVPLPRIYLAHRVPPFGTDAFDALDVAADVLGSGRASRLYASLVREQRLAQDASVFVFPIVGGASMFALWVTARPGVAPETLEAATLAELDRLAADGPTDPDLERVRNLHAVACRRRPRAHQRARRSAQHVHLPLRRAGAHQHRVSRYAAVDADRVADALRDSVHADNRVTLTYVPAEAAA